MRGAPPSRGRLLSRGGGRGSSPRGRGSRGSSTFNRQRGQPQQFQQPIEVTPLAKVASQLHLKLGRKVTEQECVYCARSGENAVCWVKLCCDSSVCLMCSLRILRQTKDGCPRCRKTIVFAQASSGFVTGKEEVPVDVGNISGATILAESDDLASLLTALLKNVCVHESCLLNGDKWSELRTFESYHKLQSHLKQEHSLLVCEYCQGSDPSKTPLAWVLYTDETIKAHYKSVTKQNQPVHPYCEWCKKHYADMDVYLQHQFKEHINCEICRQRWSDNYYGMCPDKEPLPEIGFENLAVLQEERNQGFTLNIGGDKDRGCFKDMRTLQRHDAQEHYPCPNEGCKGTTFSNYEDLLDHWTDAHPKEKLRDAITEYLKKLKVSFKSSVLGSEMGKTTTRRATSNPVAVHNEDTNCGNEQLDDFLHHSIMQALERELELGQDHNREGMDAEFANQDIEEGHLPQKITRDLALSAPHRLRHLQLMQNHLGSLFIPIPLLDKLSSRVAKFHTLTSTVLEHVSKFGNQIDIAAKELADPDSPLRAWQDEIMSILDRQPRPYLILMASYIQGVSLYGKVGESYKEPCDVLQDNISDSIKDEGFPTLGDDSAPNVGWSARELTKEDEYPELGSGVATVRPNEQIVSWGGGVQYVKRTTMNQVAAQKTKETKWEPREEFPSLGGGQSILPKQRNFGINWSKPAKTPVSEDPLDKFFHDSRRTGKMTTDAIKGITKSVPALPEVNVQWCICGTPVYIAGGLCPRCANVFEEDMRRQQTELDEKKEDVNQSKGKRREKAQNNRGNTMALGAGKLPLNYL